MKKLVILSLSLVMTSQFWIAQSHAEDFNLSTCYDDCFESYQADLEICSSLPIEWQYECNQNAETSLSTCTDTCDLREAVARLAKRGADKKINQIGHGTQDIQVDPRFLNK
jgi:hypothetical protein